ncbi:hypothetical protein HYPSUDRAFT_275187 [Hypholoma sublateritium FD-334 SS-4]|uniref:Secreted protein n=1 Tax=Hypholoma sublateritium (strain FD-334 SS-4) TaxID=945553 RepID=A0A0D2Q4B2_HYPSF|nr:hypothetical protein HYPSUDRAFT_275187 [Hypholoma sublateritium FD-334 SS-4]
MLAAHRLCSRFHSRVLRRTRRSARGWWSLLLLGCVCADTFDVLNKHNTHRVTSMRVLCACIYARPAGTSTLPPPTHPHRCRSATSPTHIGPCYAFTRVRCVRLISLSPYGRLSAPHIPLTLSSSHLAPPHLRASSVTITRTPYQLRHAATTAVLSFLCTLYPP